MAFLTKTDKAIYKHTLKSLRCEVYVRSMSGDTRKLVFAATANSKAETAEVPAEQFCKLAARACSECVLGENREPVADAAWWYDQSPRVLQECWELITIASGITSVADEAAKKNLSETTRSEPYSASDGNLASLTQTNCEPSLAAAK